MLLQDKKKLAIALLAVFAVNIAIFAIVVNSDAATYREGARGEMVKTIQTKLKNWGYYTGNIDSIWGPKTTAAVKYFQKKNGLTADGIVGTRTMAAMGITDTSSSNTNSSGGAAMNSDVELLAKLITAEARGEPYNGQVAVAAVVLNRVKHPSFPNTMSGVIYQAGAFSCLDDGQWGAVPIQESCRQAARDALNGVDPSHGAIYYYNPVTATNQWIRSRPIMLQIGKHVFCM